MHLPPSLLQPSPYTTPLLPPAFPAALSADEEPAASSPREGSFVPWPFSPAAAPTLCGHQRFLGSCRRVLVGPYSGVWGGMVEEGAAVWHVSGREGSPRAEAPCAAPQPVGHTQAGTALSSSSLKLGWAKAGPTLAAASLLGRSHQGRSPLPNRLFFFPREDLGLQHLPASCPWWLLLRW